MAAKLDLLAPVVTGRKHGRACQDLRIQENVKTDSRSIGRKHQLAAALPLPKLRPRSVGELIWRSGEESTAVASGSDRAHHRPFTTSLLQ